MTFNEFNKMLNERISDPQVRFVLAQMYEHVMAIATNVDACATVVTGLANTVGNMVDLHASTQGHVDQLKNMIEGRSKDFELRSVPITDDPGKPQ